MVGRRLSGEVEGNIKGKCRILQIWNGLAMLEFDLRLILSDLRHFDYWND